MYLKRTQARGPFIACLLALGLLTGVGASAGTTLYVSNTGNDANAGTDVSIPLQHIQTAINATVSGDTVIVADGIYTGTGNKDLDFGGRNITVRSASGDPNLTIIDCQQAGRGFYFQNGETTASVRGFTVKNGSIDGYGGGIYIYLSSPGIFDCSFIANNANLGLPTKDVTRGSGGGIAVFGGAPRVSNCSFKGNDASWGGGGIFIEGAATVTDCTFSGNSAFKGGGMYTTNSNPTVIDCAFSGNTGAVAGGGMYNINSNPTVTNCTFSSNNCTFSSPDGITSAGIYNSAGCTTLTNCILWGDTGNEIYDNSLPFSSSVVTFCDVQGGYPGSGNLNSDPLFVRSPSPGPDGIWGTADDDFGDLRLQGDSPCINAGNNAAVSTSNPLDLDGRLRIMGGTADMGAYEVQISLTRGGFRYNRASGRFVQTVTLTNLGPDMAGPISLALDRLSANAALFNLTAVTTASIPAGSPYIDIRSGDMAAGTSVSVTLEFTNPTRETITYNIRVLTGSGAR